MAKKKKKRVEHEVWLKNCYDIDNIIILDHAVERFIQRIESTLYDAKHPRNTIRTMMYGAKKEQLKSYISVVRLINNNQEPAEYFVNQNLRFVISKGVVKTIENIKRERNY